MKKWVTVYAQWSLLSMLPTMFELSSLQSPYWLLQSEGTYRGLKTQLLKGSTEADTNVEVLDGPTFTLMISAAVLLWIQTAIFQVVAIVVTMVHDGTSPFVRIMLKVVYVGIGMYIVASFIMLAACISFASLFPMERIQLEFFFTMATFCYIWLIVLIFVCDYIFKKRKDKLVCSTLICGLREISEIDVAI